jgi:hypothetical protein
MNQICYSVLECMNALICRNLTSMIVAKLRCTCNPFVKMSLLSDFVNDAGTSSCRLHCRYCCCHVCCSMIVVLMNLLIFRGARFSKPTFYHVNVV